MIRPLEARDVDAVLAIQSACPEIGQWNAWDYMRVAHGEMSGWVAQPEEVISEIGGFLVARRIAGDIEILNLAVRPAARRRGVASALLREAFAWGKLFEATSVVLEVRETNLGALQFYERHGFKAVGRRKQYYLAPPEDALVLQTTL